jgi:hypothetical protein
VTKTTPPKPAPKPKQIEAKPQPEPPKTVVEPKAAPAAVIESKPGIAIKDLASVHGVAEGVAMILNELMLTRLKGSERFSSVIGGSDMAAMIDLEAQKQALGCDEESCLAELGGALGVPYMLAAHLAKIGSRYVVTMKVISIEETKVVVRQVGTAKNEDGLLDVVDSLLGKVMDSLLGKAAPKALASGASKTEAAPAPQVASGGDQKSSFKALKWTGLALSASGAGWAAYSAMRWTDQQSAFDERSAWDSDELANLENQSKQANAGLAGGLGAAGVGIALAWWGW